MANIMTIDSLAALAHEELLQGPTFKALSPARWHKACAIVAKDRRKPTAGALDMAVARRGCDPAHWQHKLLALRGELESAVDGLIARGDMTAAQRDEVIAAWAKQHKGDAKYSEDNEWMEQFEVVDGIEMADE